MNPGSARRATRGRAAGARSRPTPPGHRRPSPRVPGGRLWLIETRASPPAEASVADILEGTTGRSPVVTTDVRTGQTRVAIYLPGDQPPTRRLLETIRQNLRERCPPGLAPHAPRLRVRRLPQQNWAEAWKHHFPPLDIAGRLLVLPPWLRRRASRGRAVVILDPGLSFGTGHHPTTRFCLRQLVHLQRDQGSISLLDVGTGSGLLAIAAAKLGYNPIRAIDNDPAAVRTAQSNARQNRVRHRITFARCDLAQLPACARVRYDVLCANLTTDLLLEHLPKLRNHLAPGGYLVLAGILRREFRTVAAAAKLANLRCRLARTESEWRSGLFQRTDAG